MPHFVEQILLVIVTEEWRVLGVFLYPNPDGIFYSTAQVDSYVETEFAPG